MSPARAACRSSLSVLLPGQERNRGEQGLPEFLVTSHTTSDFLCNAVSVLAGDPVLPNRYVPGTPCRLRRSRRRPASRHVNDSCPVPIQKNNHARLGWLQVNAWKSIRKVPHYLRKIKRLAMGFADKLSVCTMLFQEVFSSSSGRTRRWNRTLTMCRREVVTISNRPAGVSKISPGAGIWPARSAR